MRNICGGILLASAICTPTLANAETPAEAESRVAQCINGVKEAAKAFDAEMAKLPKRSDEMTDAEKQMSDRIGRQWCLAAQKAEAPCMSDPSVNRCP